MGPKGHSHIVQFLLHVVVFCPQGPQSSADDSNTGHFEYGLVLETTKVFRIHFLFFGGERGVLPDSFFSSEFHKVQIINIAFCHKYKLTKVTAFVLTKYP